MEWLRRGVRRTLDSYVLHGVGCLSGSHSVPMATSLFSVPYLTVSAESKLFTLILSIGLSVPVGQLIFGTYAFTPQAVERAKTKLLELTVLPSPGLPAARGAPCIHPVLSACFQDPVV